MSCVPYRTRRRKVFQRAGWILIVAFAWIILPVVGYSQGDVGHFAINDVKINDFPLVELQVAVKDSSGQSINILTGTHQFTTDDHYLFANIDPIQ